MLSNLAFAFVLGIGAIPDYEITPGFSDGVDDDDDASVPFPGVLPTERIKDFSRQEALTPSAQRLIVSRSVAHLSVAAQTLRLTPREGRFAPLKRLLLAKRRPSRSSDTDPD